jgi:hypothetical protein
LHGWNRGSELAPSPLHILQVSTSPVLSSPSPVFVAYCGSFMMSGSGSAGMTWISSLSAIIQIVEKGEWNTFKCNAIQEKDWKWRKAEPCFYRLCKTIWGWRSSFQCSALCREMRG